ncbi:hypothetical protein ID866_11246 [Astraeus odoratus]|nr:hypothetical protein ID866_11246 [Astraeus odoratus]
MLEHYTLRAVQYSISLNGQIARDERMTPLRGGFPVVYRGTLRQRVTEKKVAIKIYLTSQRDDDMLKRIVRQINLWSKLRHENVHHILGISTDFDCTISIISIWMAMGNAHLYVQNKENDPRPLVS